MNMRVLALNFGSSTLKYAVFTASEEQPSMSGTIVRPQTVGGALDEVHRRWTEDQPDAVVHRVVHAGESRTSAALFDLDTERKVERAAVLAPVHNANALEALSRARVIWPDAIQVAVFDTAFHNDMPAHASSYAVPLAWRLAGVRRYGFHGLSHQHVLEAVGNRLGVPQDSLRLVSCHLGNGASVCAISGGRSMDTSMGLTPLEGLIMGTRCGDLDPGVVPYVARTLGLSVSEIEQALSTESGMAALGGQGGDVRRIEAAAGLGDQSAQLALDAYAYRICKYIGAYAAALGGCDAIAFTGGVGENSPTVRSSVLGRLEFLGFRTQSTLNELPAFDVDGVAEFQESGSSGRLLIVQAREEWAMARQAQKLLN